MDFAHTKGTASIFSLIQIDQAVSVHTREINQQVIERLQ